MVVVVVVGEDDEGFVAFVSSAVCDLFFFLLLLLPIMAIFIMIRDNVNKALFSDPFLFEIYTVVKSRAIRSQIVLTLLVKLFFVLFVLYSTVWYGRGADLLGRHDKNLTGRLAAFFVEQRHLQIQDKIKCGAVTNLFEAIIAHIGLIHVLKRGV